VFEGIPTFLIFVGVLTFSSEKRKMDDVLKHMLNTPPIKKQAGPEQNQKRRVNK